MLIIKLQFKDIINENRKPFFKLDEDLLSEALENIDKNELNSSDEVMIIIFKKLICKNKNRQ